jgi:hypothetical protein
MTKTVAVPVLDHDKYMLSRFKQTVSTNGIIERRIVANLCAHLIENGFILWGVDDGEAVTEIHKEKNQTKAAMELIFNLDDAVLIVAEGNSTGERTGINLTLGEGFEIVSDYSYIRDSKFMHVMDAFDAEDFA